MAKTGCKGETTQHCINVLSCAWHKMFRKHQAMTSLLTGINVTLLHITFLRSSDNDYNLAPFPSHAVKPVHYVDYRRLEQFLCFLIRSYRYQNLFLCKPKARERKLR